MCTAALGLPVSGIAAATPLSGSGPNGAYLALGDSVAFGYVPPEAVPAPNYADPSSFVGYPDDVAQQLGLTVTNASCPGETTASMITAGAQSNGCENSPGSPMGYRTQNPLHVSYQGTQTAYALSFLANNPRTRLVTINIGANDGFLCQEITADHCTSAAELGALLTEIEQNLGSILGQIRGVAHYQGPLVVLTYYQLNSDPALTASVEALDSAIAAVTTRYGGIVADGFAAFHGPSTAAGGDPCAAGLLIKLPDGTCNIHPSAAGHMLLAAAITNAMAAGCWLVAGDGGVFSSGPAAQFHGSAADVRLAQPIVGMASTPDRAGYWLVARDGGVFTYGDATFFGSTGAMRLNQPIVAMAATTDGNGYWLLGGDGGVFAFGDAPFLGSAVGRLAGRAVAIAADPSGNGYRVLGADGTVLAFGVPDLGSARVNAGDAAVGMAMTLGGGYWITTRAGQVMASVSGPSVGSYGQITVHLTTPIVAIVATPDSKGYDLVAADGAVFAFGDAASAGALKLKSPVVGGAAAT